MGTIRQIRGLLALARQDRAFAERQDLGDFVEKREAKYAEDSAHCSAFEAHELTAELTEAEKTELDRLVSEDEERWAEVVAAYQDAANTEYYSEEAEGEAASKEEEAASEGTEAASKEAEEARRKAKEARKEAEEAMREAEEAEKEAMREAGVEID